MCKAGDVTVNPVAAGGFSSAAATYARIRPTYARGAIGAIKALCPNGASVLDVAAGTGILSGQLVRAGLDVAAVEPLDAMARQLRLSLPEVALTRCVAEALAVRGRSIDLISVGQGFHWFDVDRALSEAARVLRPGGVLALVWNVRDESVDWVVEITRIITPYEGDAPRFYKGDWRKPFPQPGFSPLVETRLTHEHVGPPQQVIVDRFMSISFIAALPDAERAAVRAQIEALIQRHPALRGQETVRFPYTTLACHCERV